MPPWRHDRSADKPAEQFILTVSGNGYGKCTSSYEFRISNRGGKGIKATDQRKLPEIGNLVAAFPVERSGDIMLVSDGGRLIRVPVDDIRFASRASKGVRIFKTAEGEKGSRSSASAKRKARRATARRMATGRRPRHRPAPGHAG